MSKNSGNTRTSSPSQGWQPDAYEAASEERINAMIDSIHKHGDIYFDREDMRVWDAMDTDERELMLMQAGFTGMTDMSSGELSVIHKSNIKVLLAQAEEALVNDWEGYNGSTDNSFAIGYKDGTVKYVDDMSGHFEAPANLARLSSSGKYAAARKMIGNTRNVAFVTNNNSETTEYAHDTKSGNAMLKKFTGWEEWKGGRGEKRRNYIQDDWV